MMKKNTKKYEIDMLNGNLPAKVMLFSLPLMLTGVLQLLFNAADIIVVGQVNGRASMGAIGTTVSTIQLLIGFLMGFSVGTNVLVARYYGGKETKRLSNTVHTAIMISIIGGVIMMIVGIALTGPILHLLNTPEDVYPLSRIYMTIYFIGLPANMLYNFGSAILRGIGDTRRPLYFLMAAGVFNVALNLFFVIVLRLDVAGVALATVISQIISASLIIRCLLRTQEDYRLQPSKLRISRDEFRKIFAIGVPAGLQSSVFSISNMLIQSSINSFGTIAIAGNTSSLNIEGFIYIAMNSMAQACVAFTSQNYGAGKFERLGKVLRTCTVLVVAVGLILGIGTRLFASELLGLYASDVETIRYGVNRIAIISVTYFLCGIMDVVSGAVRGLGHSFEPMVISLLGACALRILWVYTIFRAYHSLEVLYISYPITWIVTSLAQLGCYLVIRKKIMQKVQSV